MTDTVRADRSNGMKVRMIVTLALILTFSPSAFARLRRDKGEKARMSASQKHILIFCFISYTPLMADIQCARQLRKDETWAEKLLWRDAEADKLVYALRGLTPEEKILVQAAAK